MRPTRTGIPGFSRCLHPAEVVQVAGRLAKRTVAMLERRGLGPDADPEEADSLARDEPLLAALTSASVAGRISTGPHAGQRVLTGGIQIDARYREALTGPRSANVAGFSLHANVAIAASARPGLERLCRYTARPPLATERLSSGSDGRIAYRLKRPWSNGTTHIILEPLELVEKLAALVPPPRFHLVRYHGVLAPAAKWRSQIVPAVPHDDAGLSDCPHSPATEESVPQPLGRQNYSLSQLMRRVFAIDVLECPRCGGRLRILAAIQSPDAIRKILDCLGLPSRAPPIRPAMPRNQAELEWA